MRVSFRAERGTSLRTSVSDRSDTQRDPSLRALENRVMPAEAGIHFVSDERWTPAFAGVTIDPESLLGLEQRRIDKSRDRRSDNRGHPEEPQLPERPAMHEEGGAGAASWIHREIVYGYPD
jgi:hypothetical protein